MRSGYAPERYSRVAVTLHWVLAAMILFNLWLGIANEGLPREWKVMPVHKAMGITILALSVLRLLWRMTHRAPELPRAMPGWEKGVAKATHAIFYALMIVVPLTGWAMSSVGRNGGPPRPLTWFWQFDIPYLPVSPGVAGAAGEGHEVLGWAFAVLVAFHILAALRHQFLLRDRLLARMR